MSPAVMFLFWCCRYGVMLKTTNSDSLDCRPLLRLDEILWIVPDNIIIETHWERVVTVTS